MPLPLTAGLLLTVTGLVALCFDPYALARSGRSQRSGIGPLSERGVHALAGIRMQRLIAQFEALRFLPKPACRYR